MIPIRDHLPTRHFAWVTAALIAVNALAFLTELLWKTGGVLGQAIYTMGVVPYEVTHSFSPQVAISFLTSIFLHGGFMHIGSNMLYLWVFGNNVEDAMGKLQFLVFYLSSGFVATGAQVFAQPNAQVPTIGASGAIAGVLGAYILMFPRSRIDTVLLLGWFIRVVRLPAIIVLGFWFILQLFNGVLSLGLEVAGGVAWFAHIGGFIMGMTTGLLLRKRRRRWL
ncbi:MAG: rhomboid family intramembrane serine protease [Chloroflexota bacterium]|nr:rhomboid family intramembrane serine protease [Chloroflexota bacterium]